MNDVLLIGVSGGSGSGKTTLCETIYEKYTDDVLYIRHDDYYKPTDDLSASEREDINYDHPAAFDTELLIEHLDKLICGSRVNMPVYDYTVHNRSAITREADPRPVIIVDGILIFENEILRNMFDIKIFIETDSDVRLARRIRRDTADRGRSLDSVLSQYLTTVKPMYDMFVEPCKRYADIILNEGGKNIAALNMIEKMIAMHIKSVEKRFV